MALIHSHVEGSLPPLAAGIEVSPVLSQQLHHSRLITVCCMVDGPVTILVLGVVGRVW